MKSWKATGCPLIKLARNSRWSPLASSSWRAPFSPALLLVLSRAPCCTVAGIYYVEYGAFGSGKVGVIEGLSRHGGGGVATAACLAAPCLPGPRSPEARCLATLYWSHPVSPVSTPLPHARNIPARLPFPLSLFPLRFLILSFSRSPFSPSVSPSSPLRYVSPAIITWNVFLIV